MHRSTCGSYTPPPPLAARGPKNANPDRSNSAETVPKVNVRVLPPYPPTRGTRAQNCEPRPLKCSETVQNDIVTSTSTAHDLDPSLLTSEDDLDPPCPPLDHPSRIVQRACGDTR